MIWRGLVLICVTALATSSGVTAGAAAETFKEASASAPTVPLVDRLRAFKAAYPDAIREVSEKAVTLKSGEKIAVDDGRSKGHAEKLDSADVEDMLSQIYPIGRCVTQSPPPRNFDPGRIRSEAFFRAVYGASRSAVSSQLGIVNWFGTRVPVTRVGGVDRALQAVAMDLDRLPAELSKYFTKTAGTFNWRKIAGTERLSAHSFGAAIDIAVEYADYWRWAGGRPGNVPAYQNKIPQEIVEVFERHGFIWGGRWYHYDTMHFEYRPELISIGRLAEKLGCPAA